MIDADKTDGHHIWIENESGGGGGSVISDDLFFALHDAKCFGFEFSYIHQAVNGVVQPLDARIDPFYRRLYEAHKKRIFKIYAPNGTLSGDGAECYRRGLFSFFTYHNNQYTRISRMSFADPRFEKASNPELIYHYE